MANEIHIDYGSSDTLYAVIRNKAGQVWEPSGQVFETWGASSHDADDYDVSLTDKSGDRYVGDFDGNISAGRYTVQVFLQAGANPADGDNLIGSSEFVWSGSGEITADKILGNKAVQDKNTGKIDYYDDDNSTVILTHTPTDSESTLTRTTD